MCIRYEINPSVIKAFQWSKKKEKTAIMNLGKVVFDDFNFSKQVCAFGAKGTEKADSSYLVVGGYQDNSFKVINKQIVNSQTRIKHTVYFHKVNSSLACLTLARRNWLHVLHVVSMIGVSIS